MLFNFVCGVCGALVVVCRAHRYAEEMSWFAEMFQILRLTPRGCSFSGIDVAGHNREFHTCRRKCHAVVINTQQNGEYSNWKLSSVCPLIPL